MPVSLRIPDNVLAALKVPPRSVEQELRNEFAVHLAAEGLPPPRACQLAGLTRIAFERLLGGAPYSLRYTAVDLDHDVAVLSAE